MKAKRNDNGRTREIPVTVPTKEDELQDEILSNIAEKINSHIRTETPDCDAHEIADYIIKTRGFYPTEEQIINQIARFYFPY